MALSENLTKKDGAALGCRYMTAYRAVSSRARVQAGETVILVGIGGVGQSAVQIATAMGALVIAVDTKANTLESAKRQGAGHVINSRGLSPKR